jgi:hypothetical protein
MTSSSGGSGADANEVRIFSVVTNFQKLALRPGGVPRDKAIAQADAELRQMKPEFDKWIDEEIEALRSALPAGGQGAGQGDWVAAAATHAGRLRDVGSTAGYELVTFVANAMCDILESGEAATARGIDSLNTQFDALQLVRRPQYYRLRPEDLPELKNGLLRVVARVGQRADGTSATER